MNNQDYFSRENEWNFMSYSQFKDFMDCQERALATIHGTYEKPKTTALLQGSYVDAYFSGELEQFKAENPSLFKKDGTLKSDFALCDTIIQTIESDGAFRNEFFTGDPQVILTGEIAGVPFKGKIDMLYPEKIVDMKCMASVDSVWSDKLHKRVPFYAFYGYHIQAAIYQELVRQNYGIKLPYYLAVTTKEAVPLKAGFEFSQEVLDEALALVEDLAPTFQQIKLGKVEPTCCGSCDYCKSAHPWTIFDIELITKEKME